MGAEKQPLQSQDDKSAPQGQPEESGSFNDDDKGSYLMWLGAAVVLACASYLLTAYYHASDTHSASISMVPESYAVCTDAGKIYTIDNVNPTVDCILIHRDEFRASGTIGVYIALRLILLFNSMKEDLNKYWDQYQDELIKTFYGNEPKAKKPLVVYRQKPGNIIVPGLAGRCHVAFDLVIACVCFYCSCGLCTDAHAHLIQYGFKMQLQLDNVSSLNGNIYILHLESLLKTHVTKKSWISSKLMLRTIQICTMIPIPGYKVWVGTKRDGTDGPVNSPLR